MPTFRELSEIVRDTRPAATKLRAQLLSQGAAKHAHSLLQDSLLAASAVADNLAESVGAASASPSAPSAAGGVRVPSAAGPSTPARLPVAGSVALAEELDDPASACEWLGEGCETGLH